MISVPLVSSREVGVAGPGHRASNEGGGLSVACFDGATSFTRAWSRKRVAVEGGNSVHSLAGTTGGQVRSGEET